MTNNLELIYKGLEFDLYMNEEATKHIIKYHSLQGEYMELDYFDENNETTINNIIYSEYLEMSIYDFENRFNGEIYRIHYLNEMEALDLINQ